MVVLLHYALWGVFVLHWAIEFLKRHLVMAGVGVGLTIGLVVEFLGDLPVFSTSGVSASLLLNLGMLALVVMLSGLPLKWPDEFLQAIKNSVAWRYECMAERLETGRLGRWIDRLSRRDSVRE